RMVQDINRSTTTAADPATVYALLRDGATWPTWSPLGSFELERPAPDGEPEGVGAVRIFRTGRVTSRERIVELVPERRLSYILLSGLPLRGYRADVDIIPQDDGTTKIRWHSTFAPKVPGTGWLYRLTLGRFIGRVVDGLAAHAARQPVAA
ncbi:MAG TPA: SRPBCC family protein, partial [Solirubrobacteraceae bacterium]